MNGLIKPGFLTLFASNLGRARVIKRLFMTHPPFAERIAALNAGVER